MFGHLEKFQQTNGHITDVSSNDQAIAQSWNLMEHAENGSQVGRGY